MRQGFTTRHLGRCERLIQRGLHAAQQPAPQAIQTSSHVFFIKLAFSSTESKNALQLRFPGEVDERFKSHAWKACVG